MVEVLLDQAAVDPDNVPETLCIGKFNITFSGALATLTFTHARPKVGALIDTGVTELESVVRARIVTTTDNMIALRDVLVNVLEHATDQPPAPSGGKPN